MNRPAGIILSAVALSLLSLFQLLGAVFMFIGALVMRHTLQNTSGIAAAAGGPEVAIVALSWMRFVPIVMACFSLGLATWGIVTMIGLLRLRNWGRINTLIIAGCVTCFSLLSLFGAVMGAIFMPAIGAQPGAPAPPPPSVTHLVFGMEAFFCLLLAALGVWWLVYFNQRTTKAYFQPTAPWPPVSAQPDPNLDPYAPRPTYAVAPSNRHFPDAPVAIKILGWLWLVSSAICLLGALVPLPAFFLGLILTGAGKAALYVCFAAIGAYAGWGLLHLRESARRITIAFVAFGLLQGLLVMFPPFMRRQLEYMNSVYQSMAVPLHGGGDTETYFVMARMHVFSIAFGAIVLLSFNSFVLWLLHRHRNAFQQPTTNTVES